MFKALILLFTCLATTDYATAADAVTAARPAEFSVHTNQQQSLGIRTTRLQKSEALKNTLPALVVPATGAERVMTLPVAGVVVQILVQPFQLVRAGDPLMRIAGLELGQLQLQLIHAASRATIASQTAKREQQLFDEGIIPQRRAQEALSASKDATASLLQTRAALRLSGMSSAALDRIIELGQPEDAITVTAPVSGVVFALEVKAGERVEASTPLLHLVRNGALDLEMQIPLLDALNFPPGTEVEIPGRKVSARVTTASPTVSAANQMITLRAAVSGGGPALRPGELVQAELSVKQSNDSWVLPLVAVVHDGIQAYVFVRTSNGFSAQPVRIVATAGQSIVVRGKLRAGDSIAISGIVALKGAWINQAGHE